MTPTTPAAPAAPAAPARPATRPDPAVPCITTWSGEHRGTPR